MVLNLSKVLQQKADVLQSLRDRTKTYLSKWGYSQKAMAAAVDISETYLNDFLNGRRGMSEVPFAKIEQILSVTGRKGNCSSTNPAIQVRGSPISSRTAKTFLVRLN
jgi:transcriptional regulator with XRE-family HTH domain